MISSCLFVECCDVDFVMVFDGHADESVAAGGYAPSAGVRDSGE